MANAARMEELLRKILAMFPQADPDHELYNDDIDGCEAVDFISHIVPLIKNCLEEPDSNSSEYECYDCGQTFIERPSFDGECPHCGKRNYAWFSGVKEEAKPIVVTKGPDFVEFLIARGFDSSDLDELVAETHSACGGPVGISSINNGGITEQVNYMRDHGVTISHIANVLGCDAEWQDILDCPENYNLGDEPACNHFKCSNCGQGFSSVEMNPDPADSRSQIEEHFAAGDTCPECKTGVLVNDPVE